MLNLGLNEYNNCIIINDINISNEDTSNEGHSTDHNFDKEKDNIFAIHSNDSPYFNEMI